MGFENSAFRKSVLHNRKFIEENADYKINMKIANRYHELIDSAQNASDEPN
jgi:hypothetical protein